MKFYESGEYRASKDWPYAVAAGCVVYRREKDKVEVLLIGRSTKHDNNQGGLTTYNLPKGHVELKQSLEETALRETLEEAAVRCEISTYLGSINRDFVHPHWKTTTNKTTHYFAADWLEDMGDLDEEHDIKCWFSLEEARELLCKSDKRSEEEVIDRLKKFLEVSSEL